MGALGGVGEDPRSPTREGGCDLKGKGNAGKDCQEGWHGAEFSFAPW